MCLIVVVDGSQNDCRSIVPECVAEQSVLELAACGAYDLHVRRRSSSSLRTAAVHFRLVVLNLLSFYSATFTRATYPVKDTPAVMVDGSFYYIESYV